MVEPIKLHNRLVHLSIAFDLTNKAVGVAAICRSTHLGLLCLVGTFAEEGTNSVE